MTKNDLTVSEIERQNILNNAYALEEIEKGIGIKGKLRRSRKEARGNKRFIDE